MELRGTKILDTFAEAFDMRYVKLLITAHDDYWLQAAIREYTGYSSSVIACDAEAGVEAYLDSSETPDGRSGASLLTFGFSKKALTQAVPNRTGQCLMTCPTTAVFDGLAEIITAPATDLRSADIGARHVADAPEGPRRDGGQRN